MVLFVAQFHAEVWLCVAPVIVAVGQSQWVATLIDHLLTSSPVVAGLASLDVTAMLELERASAMYEWTEEQQAITDAVRRFVDEEIRPQLDDLEYDGMPPYGILRKMFDVFGLKEMAKEGFKRQLDRKVSGEEPPRESRGSDRGGALISTIELVK